MTGEDAESGEGLASMILEPLMGANPDELNG